MYHIRNSDGRGENQRSLGPSLKNDALKGANHIRQIYNDGMIDIGISTSAGTRLEMSRILEHAEPEPEYTSDAIDRGEFDVIYHPVTGQRLDNLFLKRDPVFGCFVFVERASQTTGWGGTESNILEKQLPRIGNGMSRSRADFPLLHWKYDCLTGVLLKK